VSVSVAGITVADLSLSFPLIGADTQSLKRYLKNVAIGGTLARKEHSRQQSLVALRRVNLSLAPGDRLGLIGANGSGKTTLLRCLAGAYAPDEGTVEVRGRVASLLDLSMGIDPSATGLENIRLRGLVAGLTPKEIAAKTAEIAEFSGLGPFLAMPMKTYSSGMQARLAFATATSVEAEVLLMDEWIAVGDAEFRRQAQERLTSLLERAHILVLASHDPNLIKSLCNKVIRMDHGHASEVVGVHQMDELMARPSPVGTI
jgi:lipopolysaccharide transport system ATP-binding protein